MIVSLSIVGHIQDRNAKDPRAPLGVDVRPTFYTGNKRSAVSFIQSTDSNGAVLDEIMLQVNDEGRLTIARKREE